MRKINFGVLALLFLFSMFLMTSCNSENSASSIKFKTIEGKISKPINGIEAPYDSISLEYAIAWPVGGNDEMQSYIKSWVINGVTQGSGIRNAKMSIDQILEAIADKMAKDENSPFEKRITVSVEENDPFDSYLSIGLSSEGLFWMAAYQDYYNDNLTIKMTDGAVFQADNAIWNTDGMRSLIAKHLERECKAEDPNWRWSEQIIDYSPYNLPLPTQPISLTKEGVLIQYGLAEISARSAGTFSCIIPYEEVMPVLTENTQDFLKYGYHSNNNNSDTNNHSDKSKTSSELSNQDIIKLIQQANIKENPALSEDLKKVTDKDTGKSTIINYSEFAYVPDITIEVSNIDMSDSGDYATVAFYFAPLYEGEYDESNLRDDEFLRLAKFVFENGTWKVDDIGWDVVTTSGDYNAKQWYKEYVRKYSM